MKRDPRAWASIRIAEPQPNMPLKTIFHSQGHAPARQQFQKDAPICTRVTPPITCYMRAIALEGTIHFRPGPKWHATPSLRAHETCMALSVQKACNSQNHGQSRHDVPDAARMPQGRRCSYTIKNRRPLIDVSHQVVEAAGLEIGLAKQPCLGLLHVDTRRQRRWSKCCPKVLLLTAVSAPVSALDGLTASGLNSQVVNDCLRLCR